MENNHNRYHQSQWLQSTLSDVENKVKNICLRFWIEVIGDTFAKRAEMYYKKEPRSLKSVEDLHGSYKSLAKKTLSPESQTGKSKVVLVIDDFEKIWESWRFERDKTCRRDLEQQASLFKRNEKDRRPSMICALMFQKLLLRIPY
ncbi:NETWORKED 3A-like protein [Tanacetum coccineum]